MSFIDEGDFSIGSDVRFSPFRIDQKLLSAKLASHVRPVL
jgi:hypothetical protein